MTAAPNLTQIEGDVFARRLAQRMKAPILLDNDSNVALLGELRFGAGRGLTNAVMFTVGTGVGAGVMLDGQIRRGAHGMVGEFGYLPVGPSGEVVEALLAGSGLVSRARALGVPARSAADVLDPGGPTLLAPLRLQFDHALLVALVAATVAYEPEAVIIGGRLATLIGPRLPDARKRLLELVPAAPALLTGELGDLSGALGALAAGCQHVYHALGVSDADTPGLPGPVAVTAIRHQFAEALVDVRQASSL